MSSAPTAREDGRRRRGRDNRARIVEAMKALIEGGELGPSAEQVAARADVGLRTVFRHFQDMDSLYRAIAMVVALEARAISDQPFTSGDWRGRIFEQIARRAQVYEKMTPFRYAADAFRHRSKFLGQDYAGMVVELRERMKRELPAGIGGETLEALDLLMSFEAWSRLRREQGLSPDHAQAVIEAAVGTMLDAAG